MIHQTTGTCENEQRIRKGRCRKPDYPIDQRCVQFQQSSAIVRIEICPHADVGNFIEGQNLHMHGMHPVEKFRCQMFP